MNTACDVCFARSSTIVQQQFRLNIHIAYDTRVLRTCNVLDSYFTLVYYRVYIYISFGRFKYPCARTDEAQAQITTATCNYRERRDDFGV